jgi:hypothetical protein
MAGSSVVMRHSIFLDVAPTTVAPPHALPSSDETTIEFAVQFDTMLPVCVGGGTGGVGDTGVDVRLPVQPGSRIRRAPRQTK